MVHVCEGAMHPALLVAHRLRLLPLRFRSLAFLYLLADVVGLQVLLQREPVVAGADHRLPSTYIIALKL
jgi:hypothetical protein